MLAHKKMNNDTNLELKDSCENFDLANLLAGLADLKQSK